MTDTPTLKDLAWEIAGLSGNRDAMAFVIANALTDAYERGQRDMQEDLLVDVYKIDRSIAAPLCNGDTDLLSRVWGRAITNSEKEGG